MKPLKISVSDGANAILKNHSGNMPFNQAPFSRAWFTTFILVVSLFPVTIMAQNTDRQTTTPSHPVYKNATDSISMQYYNQAMEALKSNEWVLQADKVYDRWGNIRFVDDNTNFVMLDKDKAYLQLAFNSFRSGPNGIGGITLKGSPTKISFKTDKKGNVTYTMNVFGTGLTATVTLWLPYGDNNAQATVDAVFSDGELNFSGQLLPLNKSDYYRSGMDF